MVKVIIHSGLFLGFFLFTLQKNFAQTGIGTNKPSKAAAFEVRSSSRGILVPRIKLKSLDEFSPITGEIPTDDKVDALLIYNTVTKENLKPGFYYWSTKNQEWQRILSNEDEEGLLSKVWLNQNNNEKATSEDENIYRQGHVTIGKSDNFIGGVSLDVQGAIRGGSFENDTNLGENSLAIGKESVASGENASAFGELSTASSLNSLAMGYGSEAHGLGSFAGGGYGIISGNQNPHDGGKALGDASFAFGYDAISEGNYSVALGYKTEAQKQYAFVAGRKNRAEGISSFAMGRDALAKGSYSVALGRNTQVEGHYSLAMGRYLKTKTVLETAFGRNNVRFSGNTVEAWHAEDPLFVLGNGSGNKSQRNNALTILKNAMVGIGIDGSDDSAKPTEMLDIGKGKVKIRDLPHTEGGINNKIAVVDEEGILKTIKSSALKSNGPWYAQGTNEPTTDNANPVYQNATVAIGKNTGITNATLDVSGSIHAGEVAASGKTTQIGDNSIAVGKLVVASGPNSMAFGYKSEAKSDGAFAGGGFEGNSGGKAEGNGAFAFGHRAKAKGEKSTAIGSFSEANGKSTFSFGERTVATAAFSTVFGRFNKDLGGNQDRWNSTETLFQIGNGTNTDNRKNALTVLKNGWVGIGYNESDDNELLRVNGSISAIATEYPDYVFKSYFKTLDDSTQMYRFQSLSKIKDFIKRYHHLPGIPSESELTRNINGTYEINLNQLIIQSLEKIEELFLYTIEQDEKLMRLTEQNKHLERENEELTNRIRKLEEHFKEL